MKKINSNIIILVTLFLFFGISLFNTKEIVTNILDYTKLFMTKLFPSSFLFFILSSLLMEYHFIYYFQKILRLKSSYLYFFLISLVSGFPSGAFYLKEGFEKETIEKETAEKIIQYTHFPNPLFIFSTVSQIIKNNSLTLLLYFSIIMSNFILLLILSRKEKNSHIYQRTYPKDFSTALSKAILKTTKVLIIIYGTSLFFYLISINISNIFKYYPYPYIAISGFFDLTNGVVKTSLLTSSFSRALFILIFLSFGGLSIHMQVKSILSDTPISYKKFIQGRILGTILSLLIFLISYRWN